MLADIRSPHDVVADLLHDGDTVAMEGFTHLIPYAAAHQVVRRRITDLPLVRMTPMSPATSSSAPTWGILRPDPATSELTLTDLHPGVTTAQVREATGRELRTADRPNATEPPTTAELTALRALKAAGQSVRSQSTP